METKTKQDDAHQQWEKRRKFLLMLPLLVFPFLTLGFKVLGGGKGKQDMFMDVSGFNTQLPEARNKSDMMDKLSFYEQAKKDSLKRLEQLRNDPYYTEPEATEHFGLADYDPAFNPYSRDGGGMDYASFQDKNERMVYEKLEQLNSALEGSQQVSEPVHTQQRHNPPPDDGLRDDLDRLEQMMLMMQGSGTEPDPAMQQINQTLETILDIQHPERIQDRIRESSETNKGQVFAVAATEKEVPITAMVNPALAPGSDQDAGYIPQGENSFFGLDDAPRQPVEYNGIAAVVHETQTLVSGSTVKLRLLDDVYINGINIPKDHFIYGRANLRGERLEVDIESVRFQKSLFPVKLAVHDLDGMAGIQIPGAITRDVAKQSGDQALQSMNLGMYNPSLGMQAASAGIELGRNLLSKKIKLIKVEVKAGYRVLLRDGKKREH